MTQPELFSFPWRTVREVPAPSVLPPCDGPVLYQVAEDSLSTKAYEWKRAVFITGDEDNIFVYRTINVDGSTGELVTRVPQVTRVWTEKPPNDRSRIVMMFEDESSAIFAGFNAQTPKSEAIAWMRQSEFHQLIYRSRREFVPMLPEDWEAWQNSSCGGKEVLVNFMNARLSARATEFKTPMMVHVPVTSADLKAIGIIDLRDDLLKINAGLAARATLPVVTGKMMYEATVLGAWANLTPSDQMRCECQAKRLVAMLVSGVSS